MEANTMKIKQIYLILLLFILLFSSNGFAQDGNTIYFMQNIPQSNYSNPALMPNCKFYLGIPGISSIRFNLDNGSFSYNDVFTRRADDSLIIDKTKLIGALSDNNKLSYDVSEQIFAMGFRARRSYITLGVNTKISTNFNYSKDFMTFLLKGNAEFIGRNANLSNTKYEANAYSEIAIGYAREFGKKFTFGVKFKYLVGIVNVFTEKSNLNIFTNPNTYDITATSDLLIHSSSPFDSIKNINDQLKDIKWKNLMDNNGYAFDFGGEFRLNKRWAFGASLIDLGSITWKTNTKDYKTKNPNKEFTFSGLDINEAFKGGEIDDKVIDNLIDSLKETIGIEEYTGVSYKAPLKTKLYLSASFALNSKNRFGLLMRNEFANEAVNTMLSVSYNTNIGRNLAITLSNTFVSGNMFNPGGGFTFNLGPFQLYMIGDHFSSVYLADMKNFGIHFGMNFVFGKTKQGYRHEKQKNIEVEEERTKKKVIKPFITDTIVPIDTVAILPEKLPVIDTVVNAVDTALINKTDSIITLPIDSLKMETVPSKDSLKVEVKDTSPPIIRKEEIIIPKEKVSIPATNKQGTKPKKPAATKPKQTIKPVK
jgi:hypothetical protein